VAAVSVLPAPEEKAAKVEAMFDRVAPSYERLNRYISGGQDRRWRERMVRDLALPSGSRILDLACGTGDLCRDLERVAGHRPIGIDFSAGMLAHAHTDAPLVRGDALCLPVPDGAADGITCGFALRNFTSLPDFFAECARALRPGGRFAFLDPARPRFAPFRIGNDIWFHRIVPRIGAALGDAEAYRYLPASTAYLPEPEEMLAMLRRAGFVDLERTTLMLGAVQLITGTRA
jgi:demethylmenaquinone methyltransferase/2-methoxy-6-polyprenyl-1,4-benzoquinol methylase